MKEIQRLGTAAKITNKDNDEEENSRIVYIATKDLKKNIEEESLKLEENEDLLRDLKKKYDQKVNQKNKLETDFSYAEAKEQELRRIVKLEEEMKKVKVRQLSEIMYQNEKVNETIQRFGVDWDKLAETGRDV